jgi:hypothetical protein
MLYPHSLLWHYLWVGPHVLQLVLAMLLWRRGFHKQFPFFFTYLVYEAAEELTLYATDVFRLGTASAWWRTCCAGMAIEGLLKFAFSLELLLHLASSRPSLARRGKRLIGSTAAVLVAAAAWAASYAPISEQYPLVSYAYIVGQTIYLIQCGLLLFIFLFAAHYHLEWNRWSFGIALASGISTCVHLATWAVFANIGYLRRGYLLDFLNSGIYHFCVLLWFYYLLSPAHPSPASIDNRVSTERETNVPVRRNGQRLEPARLLARF